MYDYSPESIRDNLGTVILGRRIELHRQVGSTNDLARQAGRRGEPEGLAVLAEEQTKGRGRLGRAWTAPPGSCILCSVLLRPRFPADHAFYLTIAAALAIHRACDWIRDQGLGVGDRGSGIRDQGSSLQNPKSKIKWPNDVLLNGKKVCGVLSESEFVGGEWAFAVVGFGINVNLSSTELGALRATAHKATALSAELGAAVDRTLLLARALEELESLYLALQNGQFGALFSEWVGALDTIGKRVSVQSSSSGELVHGQAVRVDADGALVVRTGGGKEHRVLAGDVSY